MDAILGIAAKWLEWLTVDQQVPGSNPSGSFLFYTMRRNVTTEMWIRGGGRDRNLLPRGDAPYT